MRRSTRPVNLKSLERGIAQCDERLGSMRAAQIAYHDADVAKNQRALTKALRRFREEHYAFLNASYSLGDALSAAVVRPFLRAEVEPYLQTPLASFHRRLRDCLDHGGALEFGLSIDFNFSLTIAPPKTFPITDIPTAMRFGMLDVERQGPDLGTRFMVYQKQHLEPDVGTLFNLILKESASKEAPSVILLAERYFEEFRRLSMRAARESRFKTPYASQVARFSGES